MKQIFICYSQKDTAWKEKLETYLKILRNIGWSTWSDSELALGDEWEAEIEKNLDEADIALLLISNDFLISEYIQEKELPRLLKRKEKGEIELFPILLRPCLWTEYDWLSKIQLRPTGGIALSGGTDFEVELNLTEITGEITTILRQKKNREIVEPQKTITIKTKEPEKKVGFLCEGLPELMVGSDNQRIILTQGNECILTSDFNDIKHLPPEKKYTVAELDRQNQLVVGLRKKELAVLQGSVWSYIPMDGVPLSMALWNNKIIIGDSIRRVSILMDNKALDVRTALPAPVVQIMPLSEDMVLLLDANGKVWTLKEKEDLVTEFQPSILNPFGRVYEMEKGFTNQDILLIGHKKMGIYNWSAEQLKVSKKEFPCGLRKVVSGTKNCFVLTDEGQLLILSKSLLQARRILSKEEEVVIGLNATHDKAILVWTQLGNLYQVEESGVYRTIASSKTVFAYEDFESKRIHAFQKAEKGFSLNII
ncbi:MAG: toll/interleukin-1 receptor domain-containing protein [Bacteroidota bacterium]